ncbi:polyamine ABC transporter substrate-binding protein [Limibaculum sp. M0105]|uniref:Putrescine-binding periplasmic protein n=1 Tax=Thermohalobaculum xanthum TaxID=2753746 RepID=A0A8J7M5G7_9RHOB|nr:polyamine ABC transporter substrate-binding protein [Thermohalobaculum xanthum]MBK0398661.1 polyamine ABC transporter substrate-binding protein [Thermohalobaculum xanthum]
MTRLLTGTALVALLALPAAAQDKVVNVYNWSDYIDEEILAEFTEETGIKVVYDVFDSNDILETKLLAGSSGYDVVVPSGSFLQRQIQAGVFQKLDKAKLPNLENMWDRIAARTAKYDPGNEYSINYMWGTTGIGYNVDAVKERLGTDTIDSWEVIFNPEIIAKFADCGVHMLDASDEMIPAALNYLGKDPDSKDVDDIREAAAVIAKIRPSITSFNSSPYINALADGDACIAVGWSGDILQARDRAAEAGNNVTVEYAIPKEGALMWFDQMAIPADAPHPEEALVFLDYMMRAEVAAKASNYVYYANGNMASQPLLNEDVIGDPAIYPSPETVEKLYVTTPYGPSEQRVVTREWTRIKTGS